MRWKAFIDAGNVTRCVFWYLMANLFSVSKRMGRSWTGYSRLTQNETTNPLGTTITPTSRIHKGPLGRSNRSYRGTTSRIKRTMGKTMAIGQTDQEAQETRTRQLLRKDISSQSQDQRLQSLHRLERQQELETFSVSNIRDGCRTAG